MAAFSSFRQPQSRSMFMGWTFNIEHGLRDCTMDCLTALTFSVVFQMVFVFNTEYVGLKLASHSTVVLGFWTVVFQTSVKWIRKVLCLVTTDLLFQIIDSVTNVQCTHVKPWQQLIKVRLILTKDITAPLTLAPSQLKINCF